MRLAARIVAEMILAARIAAGIILAPRIATGIFAARLADCASGLAEAGCEAVESFGMASLPEVPSGDVRAAILRPRSPAERALYRNVRPADKTSGPARTVVRYDRGLSGSGRRFDPEIADG